MNIISAITRRRTIRKYKRDKVPRSVLREAVDSARYAPSIHNLQPWRFIVVEGETKMKLATLIACRKKGELILSRMMLRDDARIIENAPAVILVYRSAVFKKRLSYKYDRLRTIGRRAFRNLYICEVQSVSCAVQNLLLLLHANGLGAAWLGAPLFRERAINSLVGSKDELMALLTVGYPAEKVSPPGRKKMDEILTFKG